VTSRGLRAWLDRFFGEAAMQPIIACRIAFGAVLFAAYATRGPWLEVLYGPAGVGGSSLAARMPSAAFGRPIDAPFRFLLASTDSLLLVYGAWALLLLASLCFLLGYRARLAGALALLLHAAFVARNPYAYQGWAWMMKPFMLYVVLSPCGAWVSIDAWRRSSVASAERAFVGTGWPLRLLRLHICTMYAVAGLSRLEDSSWRRGEMVFVAVTDSYSARFDVDWFPIAAFLEPLSYVAFVAEPLAPILLWIPGLGALWAVLLMMLHGGLELLLRDGWWQWTMMGALLAFLPPRWLDVPLRRIDRAGRRAMGFFSRRSTGTSPETR
jgi:hypothetical protein